MRDRIYLLSIRDFLEAGERDTAESGENSRSLLEQASGKVDPERREKAMRMKAGRSQAAGLGAGLLLQLAVREAAGSGCAGICMYTVPRLLNLIPQPIPLTYQYGKNGKPYFKEYPFFFNLSHSGDYVLCAVSGQEIGADIQQHRASGVERLAQRFFSAGEVSAMENCGEGKETFFYRLWTRKEAYGKLTGEGIAGTVGTGLLPGEEALPEDVKLVWNEYKEIEGYSIAVVKYA